MHPDNHLISQMQIALIGIVVVVGMFYVWRRLARIEERLDKLSASALPGANTCPWVGGMGVGERDMDMPLPEDTDAAAEEFMRQVFGYDPAHVESSTHAHSTVEEEAPVASMEANDVTPQDAPKSEIVVPTEPHPDHISEADTDLMNPLSKSKLKRMNIETLKHLCQERGLPTDGSKAVLSDRLLGLTRD